MDQVCLELNIPRKHIRATKHANHYTVLAHRAWLAGLLLPTATPESPESPTGGGPTSTSLADAQRVFPEFRTLAALRPEADEWPSDDDWQTVHLTVSVTA